MIVDAQVNVEIIAVEGNRLVVKVVKQPDADEAKSGEESTTSDDKIADESLDFEVPES
jgi:hypothetical protein